MAPDATLEVGTVLLRLGRQGPPGIAGWSVAGVQAGDVDGLRTVAATGPTPGGAPAHPNGVSNIDHVVAMTPDFGRSIRALQCCGLDLRRTREAGRGARQAFFAVGEAHLELVGPAEPDGNGPASFWGVTFVVEDLETAVERLGDLLGKPRDAVQPGRRIATVRREAGLGTAVALITPRPPRAEPGRPTA